RVLFRSLPRLPPLTGSARRSVGAAGAVSLAIAVSATIAGIASRGLAAVSVLAVGAPFSHRNGALGPLQNLPRRKPQRPHLADEPLHGFVGHLGLDRREQRRLVRNERTLATQRLHQAHPLHLPVGPLHRIRVDAGLRGQLPLRRDAVPGLQVAPGHGPLELVNDLLIYRALRIKSELQVVYPRSARDGATKPALVH